MKVFRLTAGIEHGEISRAQVSDRVESDVARPKESRKVGEIIRRTCISFPGLQSLPSHRTSHSVCVRIRTCCVLYPSDQSHGREVNLGTVVCCGSGTLARVTPSSFRY